MLNSVHSYTKPGQTHIRASWCMPWLIHVWRGSIHWLCLSVHVPQPCLCFQHGSSCPPAPGAVVTGANVFAAAAQIHVSLPHLFNGLVLTEWYHTLTVCKLHQRDGGERGGAAVIGYPSRQLCVFDTYMDDTQSTTLPDTLSLLQEVCLLWKHTRTHKRGATCCGWTTVGM